MAGQTDGAMRPSSDEPQPVWDRDRASRARTSVLLVLVIPLVIVAFLVGHRLGSDAPPGPSPSLSPSPATATLTLALADLEGAPWSMDTNKLVVYGCAVGVACGYLEYSFGGATCRYILNYHHGDTSGHVFTTDSGNTDCARTAWSRTALRVTPVADGMIKAVPGGQAENSILLERRAGPFVTGPSGVP